MVSNVKWNFNRGPICKIKNKSIMALFETGMYLALDMAMGNQISKTTKVKWTVFHQ